jgi:hypothetical protein
MCSARVKQINTIYGVISVENTACCTGIAANRRYTRADHVHSRKKEEEERPTELHRL